MLRKIFNCYDYEYDIDMPISFVTFSSAVLLLVNGTVVGAVDLRKEAGAIEEVPDWAGFIAELIGKLAALLEHYKKY